MELNKISDLKRVGVGVVNTNSDAYRAYMASRAKKRSMEARIDKLEADVASLHNKLDLILKALQNNG